MTDWQPGDPIGNGVATGRGREYAEECKRQLVASAARQCVKMPTIEARRAYIEQSPFPEPLKAEVSRIWRK